MGLLKRWWRRTFDVRRGEIARTVFMALYFFLILCAVHILKPIAWSLFLHRFSIEELARLYILIALVGGLLAYLYSRLAVKVSLWAAVAGSTLVMVAVLLALWRAVSSGAAWLFYFFAVWVNLFGIVFVSQGWLFAANIFDGREAKRLYGLLGLGAIVGGMAGGAVTAAEAVRSGSVGLMPAGIALVSLAFLSLTAAGFAGRRHAARARTRSPHMHSEVGASEAAAGDFRFADVLGAVARHRHLLLIVGIILSTYLVEVLVEFQFNVAAKQAFPNRDELTAFLGRFNGLFLGIVTFLLQVFLTTAAVTRLGVGRTLMVSPLAVGVTAAFGVGLPGISGAAAARLVEASTRYSISRTALELLYLPLPTQLKNRTKAFIDVFVDRLGRGLAALLILLLVALGIERSWQLSLLVVVFAGGWLFLAHRARGEYVATVRSRVEARRLDLENARITVHDSDTIRLLEEVARRDNERQALYALSLLGETPDYDVGPLLEELAPRPSQVIRAKVYELARKAAYPGLRERALADIESCPDLHPDLAHEAVAYILEVADDPLPLAARLMNHSECTVGRAVLEALADKPAVLEKLVSRDWLLAAAGSEDPERRALAAFAAGVRAEAGADVLVRLLSDPDPHVVAAACRAAGRLQQERYLPQVVSHLLDARIRHDVVEALAAYGDRAVGYLGALLENPETDAPLRRRLPRVLAGIVSQASVDALRRVLGDRDLSVRTAALRALGALREAAPELDFGDEELKRRIRDEAQSYFELYAALALFRQDRPGGRAARLLARTLDDRLQQTIERLFRLLGLRYAPGQIRAAYLAVKQRRRSEEFSAALELLDNILDHELREILVPMLDGSPHLLDIGREKFGVQLPTLEEALERQLRCGDAWLTACAVAAAGELKLRRLRAAVARLAASGDEVVAPVAQAAVAQLG